MLLPSLMWAETLPLSGTVDGLSLPEELPAEEEVKLLSYSALIEELHRLRQNPNQLRGAFDREILDEQFRGKPFLFRDTVKVKTDSLVASRNGLWFEPRPGLDVFVSVGPELEREFKAVREDDYITCRVICDNIGERSLFTASTIDRIEPFDPGAKFFDYTSFIGEQIKLRDSMAYFEYKAQLKRRADDLEGDLGHITGEMLVLRQSKGGQYVMEMKMDEGTRVHIECHPAYLEILLDLEKQSRVSMAVLLDRVEVREGFFFRRGCMIRLPSEGAPTPSP